MANKKILVVDDDRQLLELVTLRLTAHGFEVITAADGQEALEKARRDKPDVIILDLMLPTLNGYEVCTMLKQDTKYQEIPIIMCTVKTEGKGEQLAFACGADAYVRKPFQADMADMLLEKIQAILTASQTPGEARP